MPGWLKRGQAWGSWTCWGLLPVSPTAPGCLNNPSSSLFLTPGQHAFQRPETIFLWMSCRNKMRDSNASVIILKIMISFFIFKQSIRARRGTLAAQGHFTRGGIHLADIGTIFIFRKGLQNLMIRNLLQTKMFCVLQTVGKMARGKI